MTVILKKAEKVANVVSGLPATYTFDDFYKAFQQKYPKDLERLNKEYQRHERKTKPGKSHPMPEPLQYLRNALNAYCK
jgi:hypothetical protein